MRGVGRENAEEKDSSGGSELRSAVLARLGWIEMGRERRRRIFSGGNFSERNDRGGRVGEAARTARGLRTFVHVHEGEGGIGLCR